MRPPRLIWIASFVFFVGLPQPLVLAQSEADNAYQEGRAAFAEEDWARARTLLLKASQTAPRNPDIFVLLGRAHYQLGELDAALAAWRRTLQLAPEQAYAKSMLEALGARREDVSVRLRLVGSLLEDGLLKRAREELDALGRKALTHEELSMTRLHRADLELREGRPLVALGVLQALLAQDPPQQAAPRTRLLLGRARLAAGGEQVALGLELLRALAAETEVAESVDARFTLVTRALAEGSRDASVIAGLEGLLTAPLKAADRWFVLTSLAQVRIETALEALTAQGETGLAWSVELPEPLLVARERLVALATLPRTNVAETMRLDLCIRVRDLAQYVPSEVPQTSIKAPHAWSIELAMPLVTATGPEALQGIGLIREIVDEYAELATRESLALAMDLHGNLLDALPVQHPQWPERVLQQVDLHHRAAAFEFAANVAAGRDLANAELSDDQRRLLDLLSRLVAERPVLAGTALARLTDHLQPWFQADQDPVIEAAYAELGRQLPEPMQREARLAVADWWQRKVVTRDRRLREAGVQVPAGPDPLLTKVLEECYRLREGLVDEAPLVARLRGLRDSVLGHYRVRGDPDVVEQAIRIKAAPAVPSADVDAELLLAALHWTRARQQLERTLAEHDGHQRLTWTPALEAALTAYQDFISAHPEHRRVSEAVQEMFAIGATLERHGALALAITTYERIEAFAAGVPVLSRPGIERVSDAARAGQKRCAVLHRRAVQVVTEATQAGQTLSELAEEYRVAIAASEELILQYAHPAVTEFAVRQIQDAALHHASLDAWGVAEDIYGRLLDASLSLGHAERFSLARALCRMGPVLPAHCLELLAGMNGRGALPSATTERAMAEPEEVSADSLETAARPMAGALVLRAAGAARAGRGPAAAGPDPGRASREATLLTSVQQQLARQASRVAKLRDLTDSRVPVAMEQAQAQDQRAQVPLLSAAEIARQEKLLAEAHEALQEIIRAYPDTVEATAARAEILLIADHWRTLAEWRRAGLVVERFLTDNPKDPDRPRLSLQVAKDYLTFAQRGIQEDRPQRVLQEKIGERFDEARRRLTEVATEFETEPAIRHQALWKVAESHLFQARVITSFRPVLARGQFVRAVQELLDLGDQHPQHPRVGTIPQRVWEVSEELAALGFHDEAIAVWSQLSLVHPMHPLSEQASLRIAQTWQYPLHQPLRAVEAFLDLNFRRGGNDLALQNTILEIARDLYARKRWVEALHVLETFVDSFPDHAGAGQALTMIGQVHETNEAWDEAIQAYGRVLIEYRHGDQVQQARWSIAQSTIHLSRWREAIGSYRTYIEDFPEDGQVEEARRRISVLKNLERHQQLVDEEGQRKAFDAQHQIGVIVRDALGMPGKAILEFQKVAEHWPKTHLADDSLYEAGVLFLQVGRTVEGRDVLLAVAERYPSSPLADDALFLVGQSFEDQVRALAGTTRAGSIASANDSVQRLAYQKAQFNRRVERKRGQDRLALLKAEGRQEDAEKEEANLAGRNFAFENANATMLANWADQQAEILSASQLADRQDKINAALRKAVESYRRAASVESGDKADVALLRMARIYDQELRDEDAAMTTWLEITTQYSGTAVAEDASWKIARYYERHGEAQKAIDAYTSFLRNYRRSDRANTAQVAIAENHEQLGQWIEAMDAYSKYLESYPNGSLVERAREQINWIKTYRL